jgi:ABC-type maltose transport system permease subunit
MNRSYKSSGVGEKFLFHFADRIFDATNAVLMVFVCISIVYSLYFVVVASFTDPNCLCQELTNLKPRVLACGFNSFSVGQRGFKINRK